MKKKAICLSLLLLITSICFPIRAAAEDVIIPVYLDGEPVDFGITNGKQDNAIIIYDYNYVPIAKIIELLTGEPPAWDNTTKTATFEFNGKQYAIATQETGIYVDGEFIPSVTGTGPVIVNNRTLIPLAMLSDVLGFGQRWDEQTRTTYLTSPAPAPARRPAAASNNAITGWEMMSKMGIGMNIGNTLDANGDPGVRQGLESETMWGAEKIAKWQFEAIKMKGFDSVRIPVTWSNHMNPNTRRIDEEWFARVQECVDWALEAGLYVVINTHHEHPLYDYMICDDGANGDFDGAAKWLTDVWTQIANRFKDYPQTLLFEPMNEPNPGPGWYWDHNGQREERARLSALTNRLNRHVLDVIRSTGGNNETRVIINSITQSDAKLIDKYEHTTNDPYTMLGVFFYTGDEQMQYDQIREAIRKNIPVVLTETLPIGLDDKTRAETWARNWYPKLAALDGPPVPMWWNCYGNPPGEMFDRFKGTWVDPMVNIVFNAYGKRPGPSMDPPQEALDSMFDDSGWDGDVYWFGGFKLRDAMTEKKYLLFEVDTDKLDIQVHSGKNGYTDVTVPARRVRGTNWWYIETRDVINRHIGEPEDLGWWFQIKLHCSLKTDSGIPRAMVSDTLPVGN